MMADDIAESAIIVKVRFGMGEHLKDVFVPQPFHNGLAFVAQMVSCCILNAGHMISFLWWFGLQINVQLGALRLNACLRRKSKSRQ